MKRMKKFKKGQIAIYVQEDQKNGRSIVQAVRIEEVLPNNMFKISGVDHPVSIKNLCKGSEKKI